MASFDPKKNYNNTKKEIGFVSFNKADKSDYERIGFMSGLEIHQQLLTDEKLFCRCPAGKYHTNDDYDAEVIRHMRPTLSELGEYDGTALMEFKTRKEIIYHLNNDSACTYEVDDTPPFHINMQALERAIEISLLSKLNIVGEVHITRKQYLDGSIPTGFQRTAILGVEGEIQLKNKKVRLIQLSLEEDSCREISDIRHTRIYKTDRLGMPLIETVTYPDMVTPQELREAAEYIRFLNRSTGKVRTGMGAGREDVNVSCEGGTRVEIKGVAHNKWIPKLSHNEAFRQWALLNIRKRLNNKIENYKGWKVQLAYPDPELFDHDSEIISQALENGYKLVAINLPGFKGILSHFTQPGKIFADELIHRLKVIACIEKPNMFHSEQLEKESIDFFKITNLFNSSEDDAQLIIWGPEEDMETAIETIEERCFMAFEKVPNETRKSCTDGTTIFERVLPGADRMYPDTDSAPIPLEDEYINKLSKNLPVDIYKRFHQFKEFNVPEDTHHYILSKNLIPMIEKISNQLNFDFRFICCFFGQKVKRIEGIMSKEKGFDYNKIYGMFKFIKKEKLNLNIAAYMLPLIYEHPKLEFNSVLTLLKYKRLTIDEILNPIEFLYNKFNEIKHSDKPESAINWLMGQIHNHAIGNCSLKEISENIKKQIAILDKKNN
ncbi:Glu-tRNA(Gln) amidotransferase subunit GatE [Bacteroidota bacterium]